ncbi:MAG: 50S ribosomal protein L13 [Acidobacteria bacterium RIFCSPLOWO2_02_FULL_61_28]|nr:MAG: 50S ribosomal protein L13 [Acidobacteria bacterium RIFCSPLOWO2_02_FULL_61_28]
METYIPRQGEVEPKWYVVDAAGQVLGRLATEVATLLRGKHREQFTPFLDLGDHVIVVNAAQVRLTGNKWDQKLYRHFSGFPGGLKETGARRMQQANPERIVQQAVMGMLPKTKLCRAMKRKLLVYAGDKHPHQAQKPEVYSFPKSKS